MRIILITVFLFVFASATAQSDWYKDGTGFNSCFQNLVEGNFSGIADGKLQLITIDGERITTIFSENSASLEIIPDKNEVYDVSNKIYSTRNNDIKVLYKTYAYANEIVITKDKQDYMISLIDGGCDRVINGLDYQYVTTNKKELLIITFSEDVGLFTSRHYDLSPELIIAKGSNIVFSINISNLQ